MIKSRRSWGKGKFPRRGGNPFESYHFGMHLRGSPSTDWRIGTMGFSYADWSGPFYPDTLKQSDWLSYYARIYDAVELDTTFYAAPPAERVAKWAEATPDDFRFCVKTPRAITHDTPLVAGREPMRLFVEVIRGFGSKLGPVLIQFAPSFTADQFAAVDRFLSDLPEDVRYAVEFRHKSWGEARTLHMLHRHGCAYVSAEYASRPARVFATADFHYLRWIGIHERYPKHEKELADVSEPLNWWRSAVEATLPKVKEIYGFFNNDYAGYSPASANRFKRMIGLDVKEPTEGKTGSLFE